MAAAGWLGVALALAACGSEPARVGYRSGTRLGAHAWDVGGARSFAGFHDRMLDVDCRFGLAEDGAMRCLPEAGLSVSYDDPGCTHAVGNTPVPACGGAAPKYALRTDPAAEQCAIEMRAGTFYSVGERISPASLFVGSPGACTRGPDVAYQEVFAVTPVAASAFVAATETRVPHGALSTRVLVGDDGSRVTIGLYDEARAAPCSIDFAGDAAHRCIPSRFAFATGYYFGDAQCTQPVADAAVGCPPPDLIVGFSPAIACQAAEQLFATGAPVDKSTVHAQGGSSACLPEVAPSSDFYALGAPLSPAMFPSLMTTNVGSGRVGVSTFVDEAGQLLDVPTGNLVLRDSQQLCAPTADSDGGFRCIGADSVFMYDYDATQFADASCTRAVVHSPGCTAPSRGVVMRQAGCGQAVVGGTFAVGTLRQLPAVYQLVSGTCTPMFSDDDYEVGPPGDLSPLPVIAKVDE